MDVEFLRTLLAIVDHRSFAKAGEIVGLSRSAVSLQVRAIEREFKVTIFDRTTRPPKLTRDGEAFVVRARAMVSHWTRLQDSSKREESGSILRIGSVHTAVSGILPYALRKLRARHPQLEITLTSGLAHELEAGVRRDNFDVAILPQPPVAEPGLVWRPLCTEWLVVIASSKAKGNTDRELLTSTPFIRLRRVAWGLGRLIDQELARRGIDIKANMEVDTLEGIMSLVSKGLGVSIAPMRPIPDSFVRGIRWVPFGDPPLSRTLSLLQKHTNPAADFAEALYSELAGVSEAYAVSLS